MLMLTFPLTTRLCSKTSIPKWAVQYLAPNYHLHGVTL